jgi:hypothetical protein
MKLFSAILLLSLIAIVLAKNELKVQKEDKIYRRKFVYADQSELKPAKMIQKPQIRGLCCQSDPTKFYLANKIRRPRSINFK